MGHHHLSGSRMRASIGVSRYCRESAVERVIRPRPCSELPTNRINPRNGVETTVLALDCDSILQNFSEKYTRLILLTMRILRVSTKLYCTQNSDHSQTCETNEIINKLKPQDCQ